MNVEPWMTLSSGSTTTPVVAGAQWLLRARGHSITADGSYGPATAAAVSAFRAAQGLPAGNHIDQSTWVALVKTTQQGDSGDAVRGVQQFDPAAQPDVAPLVVDGAFGPATATAVREYQRRWGLTIDGVAGRETWSFLQAARLGATVWGMAKVGQSQATNWRVRAVQHLLRHAGKSLTVDGDYGPATGEAMRQWQQTQRATEISTTCGQLDWPGLTVTVHPGEHGHHVRAVQSIFEGLAEDGDYGPVTEARVKDFQAAFAPPADGVVGPVTWHALTVPISD